MNKKVIIIGSGPAGLMAAEIIAKAGVAVTVYDHKPSPGRKFLMAGRGGLNLTHTEDLGDFIARYGDAAENLRPFIEKYPPSALRAWCDDLGEATFAGTSGRVFPKSFKTSPLLRAWLARLEKLGVTFKFSCEWQGWDKNGNPVFNGAPEKADALLLALGGASWPRLGSDGGWVKYLTEKNITVSPLRPSNCGFLVAWSDIFREKFAGQPLKPVTASFGTHAIQGEIMISARGIEGGAVYALSSLLREEIIKKGETVITLDLRPGVSLDDLTQRLRAPKRGKSFSNFLRKEGGLSPVAAGILREVEKDVQDMPPEKLAQLIKALPLPLTKTFPIDRAISSAGGIVFDELDENLMLKKLPNVFAAGEMLDWEAPTGGYLLQATFSTAVRVAEGILKRLNL